MQELIYFSFDYQQFYFLLNIIFSTFSRLKNKKLYLFLLISLNTCLEANSLIKCFTCSVHEKQSPQRDSSKKFHRCCACCLINKISGHKIFPSPQFSKTASLLAKLAKVLHHQYLFIELFRTASLVKNLKSYN